MIEAQTKDKPICVRCFEMDYLKRALELKDNIIEDRRTIHRNPEIGCTTPMTTAYIEKRLTQMGIPVTHCGPCGLTALIGKKENGPVLLLRADIDALPMEEESGLPFASQIPGAAHCCGHDNHAAMLLTAAQLLKEDEDNLAGRVKLMFQPGEESGDGCRQMVDAGVLEDPRVDAAMAFHVDAALPLGKLTYGQGATFCSNDVFQLKVSGKSGHGARPHQAVDAINCAAHIVVALETLIARETDPSETCMLTVCSIESSSKATNIFPESVVMKGSIRTYNDAQHALLLRRFEECCTYTAKAFGCGCDIHFESQSDPVIVDNALEQEMKGYLEELLQGEAAFLQEPIKKMGSEDFAAVTSRVPSAFFFLGAGKNRQTPYPYGQHNAKVVFNEDCLPYGAAGFAYCAYRWLKNSSK